MKTSKHIPYLSIVLLFALTAAGCTSFDYEIDAEGRLPDTPLIRLSAILQTGKSGSMISAAVASPISEKTPENHEGLALEVTINGERTTTLKESGLPAPHKNEKRYLLSQELHPGDEITLDVRADGVAPARCNVQMLPDLPSLQVSYTVKSGNKVPAGSEDFTQPSFKKLTEFSITLDEEPSSDHFYAVQVFKYKESDIVIGNDYNVELTDEPYIWRESDRPSGYPEEVYTTGEEGTMMFYDRSSCENGKIVLRATVAHEKTDDKLLDVRVRYRIAVSRVSPTYYNIVRLNCQLSRDPVADLISNSLALAGSNVKGGTGIVACMTTKSSAWIYVE